MQKQCSKCKEFKPATPEHFHKDGGRKDGLDHRCKVCIKEYQQSNHPKMVEAAYRWRDTNPDKAREDKGNWRGRNRQKLLDYSKDYRLTNLEKCKQAQRNWVKNNPIKNNIKKARRRARIDGNGGEYTKEEWDKLCTGYNYTCLCCELSEPEIKLTADHVIPIVLGGKNTIDNIQPLCFPCNARKGTKIIDYRF